MPRGIYDRSKASRPQAKGAEKRTAAKKITRRPRATTRAAMEEARVIGGPSWSNSPMSTPEPKTFFVATINSELQVFDTLDGAVNALVNTVGMTAERLSTDPSAKILTVKATEAPVPQHVRLAYTL